MSLKSVDLDSLPKPATPTRSNKGETAALSYHYSRPMHIFKWNRFDEGQRMFVMVVAPNIAMARRVITRKCRDKRIVEYINTTDPMVISRPTAWILRGDTEEFEVKFLRR